jgi:hypothetical protein
MCFSHNYMMGNMSFTTHEAKGNDGLCSRYKRYYHGQFFIYIPRVLIIIMGCFLYCRTP